MKKESDIGLLLFYDGVMNKRFVAVSTVTGSKIRGCFSKPRCDFSVTRGWQQVMNAISWIKQFAEKKRSKVCRAYVKETAQHTAMPPFSAFVSFR